MSLVPLLFVLQNLHTCDLVTLVSLLDNSSISVLLLFAFCVSLHIYLLLSLPNVLSLSLFLSVSSRCSQKANLIGPVSHHHSSWPFLALSHFKVCCYLFLDQVLVPDLITIDPNCGAHLG